MLGNHRLEEVTPIIVFQMLFVGFAHKVRRRPEAQGNGIGLDFVQQLSGVAVVDRVRAQVASIAAHRASSHMYPGSRRRPWTSIVYPCARRPQAFSSVRSRIGHRISFYLNSPEPFALCRNLPPQLKMGSAG